MSLVKKFSLSGSTNDRPIAVAATASPGTLIHTADATDEDQLFVWACNIDTVDRDLTMQWGGTSTADSSVITMPSKSGWVPVAVGQFLRAGLLLRCFAAAASIINVQGHVIRHKQF